MNTQANSKRGFTIIEVVLVLAIAGLIFLIVFLAVPALQRSQRDQHRKSDMGRLIAAVQDWRANHRGDPPTPNDAFRDIVAAGSTFEDPSGGEYKFSNATAFSTGHATYEDGTIIYQIGKKCDPSDNTPTGTGGSRNIAFAMKLESKDLYCVDN